MFALPVGTVNMYSISNADGNANMLRKDFKNLLSQLDSLTRTQKQRLLTEVREESNSQSINLIESSFDEVGCCAHCGSTSYLRWGKSHQLQRYRCKDCKKTFNALTGSSLSRLRYKELWLSYSECLTEGMSIRKAADHCGIDKTTAFRWRHRFLSGPTENGSQKMVGIVEADETFFTESCKGDKNLSHRPARKRGKTSKKLKGQRVPVLIVRDRNATVADFVFKKISMEEVHNCLRPLMGEEIVLCSDGSRLYQEFAKDENIPHKRIIATDKVYVVDNIFHIQNLNAYISRLKKWMVRFNGVATKYLKNYLGWRRLLEKQSKSNSAGYCFRLALRGNDQQVTQT